MSRKVRAPGPAWSIGATAVSRRLSSTPGGNVAPDLVVYTPSLGLIVYNKVDTLRSADGVLELMDRKSGKFAPLASPRRSLVSLFAGGR